MANALSDAGANAILNAEPTLYAALSSTPVLDDGTGLTEPGAGDYVRPAISLAAAASRQRSTNTATNFVSGGAPAASTAGTFTWLALMTAASGGTVRWKEQLVQAVSYTVGTTVEIASGNITLRLTT